MQGQRRQKFVPPRWPYPLPPDKLFRERPPDTFRPPPPPPSFVKLHTTTHLPDSATVPIEDIIKKCERERRVFIDEDTKFQVIPEGCKLSRISLQDSFLDNIDPDDVNQGKLNDCWVTSVLSALASNPENIRNIIKSYSTEYGVYELCFYRNRKPERVIIDDRFVVDSSQHSLPQYAFNREGKIAWCSVSEKGYAKWLGSYDKLSYSHCQKSFADFTGGIVTSIYLKKDLMKKEEALKKLWELYNSGCCYMCSCTDQTIKSSELHKKHAYTVLGFYKVPQLEPTLVRLRDPLNKRREEDKLLHLRDTDLKHIDEAAKEMIGYKAAKESQMEFYMTFEDFFNNFSTVVCCRYIPSNFKSQSIQGVWRGDSMGETVSSTVWGENPQYAVTAVEDTELHIAVSQKNTGEEKPSKVGVRVYSLEGREAYRIFSPHNGSEDGWGNLIHNECYQDFSELWFSINVTKDKFPLVVIPTIKSGGSSREFGVDIYAKESSNLKVEEAKEWKYRKTVEEESWSCECVYTIRTRPLPGQDERPCHFVVRVVGPKTTKEKMPIPRVYDGTNQVDKNIKNYTEVACKLMPNKDYTVSLSPGSKYSGPLKINVYSNDCDFDFGQKKSGIIKFNQYNQFVN